MTSVHPRSRGAAASRRAKRAARAGPSPLTRGSPCPDFGEVGPYRSIPAHAGQPFSSPPRRQGARVHPRSRGAALLASAGVAPLPGPSPLTRGSRPRVHRANRRMGSIPAHAGQPESGESDSSDKTVHPRSRGAAAASAAPSICVMGPSPLTRGSRRRVAVTKQPTRSIPAHAGQPRASGSASTPPRVHPRSRGAAREEPTIRLRPKGPSPLTRGSLRGEPKAPSRGRSIPAHAGQPRTLRCALWPPGVHPRSRGAAGEALMSFAAATGPSPLTRGSHARARRHPHQPGSIPAHAGQPVLPPTPCSRDRVHPRSRGAAGATAPLVSYVIGPSPLTRGSRHGARDRIAHDGSIPAHAGQPTSSALTCISSTVHPRSRGAAARRERLVSLYRGPSPLTRGSLRREGDQAVSARSIPAHAGQPRSRWRRSLPTPVHPRSRGAAHRLEVAVARYKGPSPLTRGSPRLSARRRSSRRSIPAHAGQPSPAASSRSRAAVHPRSRGAAGSRGRRGRAACGPSPLTRGSPLRGDERHRADGSIPAHAGQPDLGRARRASPRVHPRSRGAADRAPPRAPGVPGPSPLTRGSRRSRTSRRCRIGSIPAHAGQPVTELVTATILGVHPRSRGAASSEFRPDLAHGGPSPLTRGSLRGAHGRFARLGSIPAHAGQPAAGGSVSPVARVHPRSRGAATE